MDRGLSARSVVQSLSPAELEEFRSWFASFDGFKGIDLAESGPWVATGDSQTARQARASFKSDTGFWDAENLKRLIYVSVDEDELCYWLPSGREHLTIIVRESEEHGLQVMYLQADRTVR